jgi:cyclophilin family peptidyl-prolyl cis-trans isomerase
MAIETVKGAIEIQLFRSESPKSVDHVLDLAKHNFYRGQRIHRVEASLVQFGDPVSRDMSRRDWWGRAGSGSPIGVAEFNKHKNVRGAVGLAHTGNAAYADSQLYICKAAMPSLDGKHVVIGQVVKGMDVVDKLQVADVLRNVTVRE